MKSGIYVVTGKCTAALYVLAIGFALGFIAPAGAAQVSYRGSEQDQSACMGDVFRLCFSDIPDERAIVACLIRSKRNLSPSCGAVFKVRTRPTATSKTKRKKTVKRRKTRRG